MPDSSRAAVAYVVAFLMADASLIALTLADGPDEQPAGKSVAQGSMPGQPPPCSSLDVPFRPPKTVSCRTRASTLTIGHESRPLIVASSGVRVLDASRRQATISVRLRIRNETDGPKTLLRRGQEVYFRVGNTRIDPQPDSIPNRRIPPDTGVSLTLRFDLPAPVLAALEEADGRAELGVRPWTGGSGRPRVGVVRLTVD